jgi:hypothetical protein
MRSDWQHRTTGAPRGRREARAPGGHRSPLRAGELVAWLTRCAHVQAYPEIAATVTRSAAGYLDAGGKQPAELSALLAALVAAVLQCEGDAGPARAGLATLHGRLARLQVTCRVVYDA